MLLCFFQPINDVKKCIVSCNVIGQEYTMCSPIENPCNRSERFLPCSVPNLQFHNLVLNFNNEWSKFHSNSDIMFFFEVIVHYSRQKTTLSDSYANVRSYWKWRWTDNESFLPVSPIIMSLKRWSWFDKVLSAMTS
jgi:hypothetical protein